MDAFSHSWKLMFAHLWPNISSALCIMVRLVPHKVFSTSIRENRFGVALQECLQTVGQQLDSVQGKTYEPRRDSSQTRSETLPEASVFTNFGISSARHECHIEHFLLNLITGKVTRPR